MTATGSTVQLKLNLRALAAACIVLSAAPAMASVPVQHYEHRQYLVLFAQSNQSFNLPPPRSNQKFVEIFYKVALTVPSAEIPFLEPHQAEIRFLDADGFIIVSDILSPGDLHLGKEFYATLWVEDSKLPLIADVRFHVLEAREIAAAHQRINLHLKQIKSAMDEAGYVPPVKSGDVQLPERTFHSTARSELNWNQDVSIIDSNIEKISKMIELSKSDLGTSTPTSTVQEAAALPAPEASEADASAEPRVTNEMLMEFIKELESKPQTEVTVTE